MNVDWENLGKRLIAANQMGIRIEQSDGHRWIFTDASSEFWKPCLSIIQLKQYGSYASALDHIDEVLVRNGHKPLLEMFETNMNYFNDLGIVFGEGTQ